jgi:hypothetical protein
MLNHFDFPIYVTSGQLLKQCAVKGAGETPVHRPDTGSLDPRSGFLGQPLQRRLRIS